LLQKRLENKINGRLLNLLPGRIPVIGGAALLHLKREIVPYEREIGEALLDLMKNVKSVWVYRAPTATIFRIPNLECVAGDCNPEVIHKELKTIFYLNIQKITFSPGNAGERKRLLRIISPQDIVLDMFACVGNLSLPIAVNVKPKKIYAIEINPLAYKYLLKNIRVNKVESIMVPFLMDNRDWKEEGFADHVLMGYLPEPDNVQLRIALNSIKPEGGTIHFHTIVKIGNEMDKLGEFRKKVEKEKFNVKQLKMEKVKPIAPHRNHVVIRAYIRKVW